MPRQLPYPLDSVADLSDPCAAHRQTQGLLSQRSCSHPPAAAFVFALP